MVPRRNPVVGYSKLKGCVRLLFWSGQSFDESGLSNEGTFKAAEKRYTAADQIDVDGIHKDGRREPVMRGGEWV